MKKIYEIYEINSYGDKGCAVASSYKKAIGYVFANTNYKAEGVKVGDEWIVYGDIEKYLKKPQKDISIFGKKNNYGYCSNGFRIIAVEMI